MPRTLILMRHAEAGNGYRDHDRPLTPAGFSDAEAAGNWLRRTLPAVDAVLCSTATRTRQTLVALGVSASTHFAEELYGGGIEDILGVIALTPATVSTLLVIGHAPGIPAAAYELATADRMAETGPVPPAAGNDPETDEPAEAAELDGLRHFSACAIAVLQTEGEWGDLDQIGARLQSVRHPRD
jgi:phosphohistidine phosphatase